LQDGKLHKKIALKIVGIGYYAEIPASANVPGRPKIERGEREKEKKTPFAIIMNTLALYSIHR
jgi:hypothetical protein